MAAGGELAGPGHGLQCGGRWRIRRGGRGGTGSCRGRGRTAAAPRLLREVGNALRPGVEGGRVLAGDADRHEPHCTFKRIERAGATTYRVTEECSYGGAAWGQEDQVETFTSTYEIPDGASYTVTSEDGYQTSARHCEQSAMSPEYRDNDIGDLIR